MSSQSLEETKMNLLLAHRQLNQAYSNVTDSLPSHTNLVDAALVEEIHEAQADIRNTNARIAAILNKRFTVGR
jgi:hypothetical protein